MKVNGRTPGEPARTQLTWVLRRRGSYVLKYMSLFEVGGARDFKVEHGVYKHFTMTWKLDPIWGAHVMGPALLPWQRKRPQ